MSDVIETAFRPASVGDAVADERFVTVDDVETRYWEAGEGEPVVLVHGGGAGADSYGNWFSCIPMLVDHYRVLAMDMVGFGRSMPVDEQFAFTQPARNAHLLGFLDAMDLSQAALVGNSMGGATALGVAMAAPERVRALVLMGSAGLAHAFSFTPELRTVIDYRRPDRQAMERVVSALTDDSFEPDPAMVDYRYELTLRDDVMNGLTRSMAWVREQGGLYYDEADVARVTTATLIVSGREDKVSPKAMSIRFNELIDDSRLYLIPHCGHWAMIERPKEFCDATLQFLAQQEGRR